MKEAGAPSLPCETSRSTGKGLLPRSALAVGARSAQVASWSVPSASSTPSLPEYGPRCGGPASVPTPGLRHGLSVSPRVWSRVTLTQTALGHPGCPRWPCHPGHTPHSILPHFPRHHESTFVDKSETQEKDPSLRPVRPCLHPHGMSPAVPAEKTPSQRKHSLHRPFAPWAVRLNRPSNTPPWRARI